MTTWFEWRTEYTVNVTEIDRQHKELFRVLNELGEALWDGKGKDTVGEALKFMADYTVEHFYTEEAFMKDHGFPDYQDHKKAHDDLVEEIRQFIGRYETEDMSSDLVMGVVNRLGDWTREHVRGMDQDLGKFLLNKT